MARKKKSPVKNKNVSYAKLVEMRKNEAYKRLGEKGVVGQRINHVPDRLKDMKQIIREDYIRRGLEPPKVTVEMAKKWADTAIKRPNIIQSKTIGTGRDLQFETHISMEGLKTQQTGHRLAGTATSRQIEKNRIRNAKLKSLNEYNQSFNQLKLEGTMDEIVEGKAKRLIGIIQSEKTSVGLKVWAHEQLSELYEDEFVAVLGHAYGEGSP